METNIQCPKCKNRGDIIIVGDTLCWCQCGEDWIHKGNIHEAEIVAAFTVHAGYSIVVRLTHGTHKDG